MGDNGDKKSRESADQSREDRSEEYTDARSAFEGLDVEEQAFFLVESAFNTVLKGLRQASDVARDAIDDALNDLEKRQQAARERAETDDSDDSDEA